MLIDVVCDKTVKILLAALFLLISVNVHAEDDFSSRALLKNCSGEMGSFLKGACHGYIMGAVNTHTLAKGNEAVDEKYQFCVPVGVRSEQLADVVENYLRNNPEVWSEFQLVGIFKALHDAWPCLRMHSPNMELGDSG